MQELEAKEGALTVLQTESVNAALRGVRDEFIFRFGELKKDSSSRISELEEEATARRAE